MKVGECYLGWATDEEIRKRGASGGLVTAMLAAALDKKIVDAVVVLKKINEFEAVPILTKNKEDVIKAAGSLHTVPVNLAWLLAGKKIKVALPAKPCDAKGVIEQAKRNQVDLSNIYLVGLNCGGSMHPISAREMLELLYQLKPEEVVGEEIEKGKLIFYTKDGEKALPIDELEEKGYGRRENCRYCTLKIPRNADLSCGNWGVTGELVGRATFVEINSEKGIAILQNAIDAGLAQIQPAEEKGMITRSKINESMEKLGDKWNSKLLAPIQGNHLEYYRKALENCIDCGACREVCPVCSCDGAAKCKDFYSPLDDYQMSMYHLVRFLHLMDSCIGCGQCTDVCPSEIPLAHLYQRFALPMQAELKYRPGMDMRKPPLWEIKMEGRP